MRGAVILAGGQSKRFQDNSGRWVDKALAILSGKPLLVHVIEGVKPVVDEIIVCVNDTTRGVYYLKTLEKYLITDVRICVDMKFSHVRGPSVAIATGLRESSADCCMILPCDTPFIKPSVVDYLLNLVKDLDICVPIHPDGNIEALMFSCNRKRVSKIAEVLCLLGRSKPVDIIRASSRTKFVSTISELKILDPDFQSFININFRSDLINLPTRVPKKGLVAESIDLNLTQPSPQELEFLGKIAKKYDEEDYWNIIAVLPEILRVFEGKGAHFWAGVLRETEGNIFHRLALLESKSEVARDHRIRSKMAFEKAAQRYSLEASIYRSRQIRFLFECASEDEIWCLNKRDNIAATCLK